MIVIPSREDSYVWLLETEKQFAEKTADVADVAVMLEKLNEALHTLTTRRDLSFMLCSIRKSARWNWRRSQEQPEQPYSQENIRYQRNWGNYCKKYFFRQVPLPSDELGERVFFYLKILPFYCTLTISYLCIRHISDRPESTSQGTPCGLFQARTICGFIARGRTGCEDTGRG